MKLFKKKEVKYYNGVLWILVVYDPSQGHLQFVMLLPSSQSNCSCSPMRFIGMWFQAVQGLWCPANLTLRLRPLMMTFQPRIVIVFCSPFTNGLKKTSCDIYIWWWVRKPLTDRWLFLTQSMSYGQYCFSCTVWKLLWEFVQGNSNEALDSHLENQPLSWTNVDTNAYM